MEEKQRSNLLDVNVQGLSADGQSVPKYLRELLCLAFSAGYSDLYFLPKRDGYLLSGQQRNCFVTVAKVSSDFAQSLIALMKYWAQLDLAENRRPQLGRFEFEGRFVRLSSVGDYLDRESVVLRLIDDGKRKGRFVDGAAWRKLVARVPRAGLFAIAGPTGSGKTSTLYALLQEWAKDKVVLTVEDPVEVAQESFLQLQVNEQAGVDYQDLIKVALRHRPDILVIGETRDGKTAEAALQAALSGHLVLTTIHANSAEQVLSRLVELGLPEVLVKEALVSTMYQWLEPDGAGHLAAAFVRVDWGMTTNGEEDGK
ncbi:Flp pilus assembly complex ATPase component TadA [Fructobacillus sp. M1-13]|uniref:Flp pilus assembly complex ATPase component TadA n=1 Tax=Fructobacillus papyriferae TaxID=2713171 RepID=A0ABS5QPS0_9LACO|nr:ATPase, T2SS/T4P/T4SS family [Fructobacillus papyriferae]MBS9335100.1 Flp pilus assembly complex ATPase component TadA [Fructobacillus papyriferae]MCD2159414.1 Flp pilus assembly complex ATPase component TadA [Fructobacillus papyriferae]